VIRPGFLDSESRQDLIELTRDGSAAHRLARRANALVLLDDGMSCASVAKVLYLDDDTIRSWHRLYQEDGIEGLASFGYEGSACRLTAEQRERLTAWITEALPRTSREIGAWIARECGLEYEGRSGLIALLHRLGMEHRKPTAISRKLDPAKQAVFIRSYEALLNQLPADEAVMFADAVHPTHAVRAVGCWALESVRRLHEGLQSFLSMRRMDARRRKASALWLRFSQSLASRRQRLSQPIVRSTIQRCGRTTNPLA
jgi:transposase